MLCKKRRLILLSLLLVIIGIVTVFLAVQSTRIEKIFGTTQKEEIKKEITTNIYAYANNKVKLLITVQDTENGIAKINYPNDEMQLTCNGKVKVAIDYEIDVANNKTYTFIATNTQGEEIVEIIEVNDTYREKLNNLIETNFIKENEIQTALFVNFKADSKQKQYKIGNTENWIDYDTAIVLDAYQIQEATNEKQKVKINLRQVNELGDEIITQKELDLSIIPDFKQEDEIIEGSSLLDCIANNQLNSGNYIFKVTGKTVDNIEETIEYPVELYNYEGNTNYIIEQKVKIGQNNYTGIGKVSSDKRMLVLKYNGDVTIQEGVTILPTGTKEKINGVTGLCTKKGMFIYCKGKIENNGTISMTAKGTVNQEGENVYLYKNIDGTYEYIPAVGAQGGASANSGNGYNLPGNNGNNGEGRQLGGGASGAVTKWYSNRSGKGASATSYSGGPGGGAIDVGGASGRKAGDGQENGGAGGKGEFSNAGGGAGNPGGSSGGGTGTGGLLMLYANEINNNGEIIANGISGGNTFAGGGSSGGGSINIFYQETYSGKEPNADGGQARGSYRGGAGGNGCVSKDKVKVNIEQ